MGHYACCMIWLIIPYSGVVRRHIFAGLKPDKLTDLTLSKEGHEVSGEVLDGAQVVVWDEAENRLHSQKALLEFLMPGENS